MAGALADQLGPTAIDLNMVFVPGGKFVMGDDRGNPNETPRLRTVQPFRIMRHEVTNDQFERFVETIGYTTDVERKSSGHVWWKTWRASSDANWRHPHGPADHIHSRRDHPVIQISARDAAAFCAHYGYRLPTEVEWEFGARGTDRRRYPWGSAEPTQTSDPKANFGTVPCCAADPTDGYLRTAPVGSYPDGQSPFGLLDMAGNVWEWTSSGFPGHPGHVVLRGGGWGNNPYCLRTAYRHGNPPDIGLDMVGFRCAADVGPP